MLRRTPKAIDQYGATAGVLLTGIGGIGKTALAGRLIRRMRDEGWAIAVHDGRWNPTALLTAVSEALDGRPQQAQAVACLRDRSIDDTTKMQLVLQLLQTVPLLLLFDDFEQNLDTGGRQFLDPALQDLLLEMSDSADVGALVITCRYPVPGEALLVPVELPPLTDSELRRLFLRLPALRELDPADRTLVSRAIGGHPRLIEFVDALLRGGKTGLKETAGKLRSLARDHELDLRQPRDLTAALDDAIALGAANILLDDLTALLTVSELELLRQASVCRSPFTVPDLAYALTGSNPDPQQVREVEVAVQRLLDLTLLTLMGADSPEVSMHPWTATALHGALNEDLTEQHRRAQDLHLHRFQQGTADYSDLLDLPRHLARLERYDDIASLAEAFAPKLPGTLATATYLTEVRPLIPVQHRAAFFVAQLELNAVLAAGQLPGSWRLARLMLQQASARSASDDTNTEWQRDLSVSHSRLGELAVTAGDLATAQQHFTADLVIAERLAAADPTNTDWQRDLSISHDKLGDLAVAAGDLTTARAEYTAALTIRERLAASDPTDIDRQRDLSVSHNNLGNLAVAADDVTTAREQYTAGLAIADG